MRARIFLAVLVPSLLMAAYQLGSSRANAQGQELQIGNALPSPCGVSGRTVYVMRQDGTNQIAFPDPVPGGSAVVGVWAQTSGGIDANARVVLANGDVFEGFYGQGWRLVGNLFSGLPTGVTSETWGAVKERYRN